jgi:hypothetical protein
MRKSHPQELKVQKASQVAERGEKSDVTSAPRHHLKLIWQHFSDVNRLIGEYAFWSGVYGPLDA